MIAAALLHWVAFAAVGAPYAWPLDLARELTSSFAEYRPGRFHAGVDLRTGASGKEVRAIGDGYVSRVRCSPWGYGKAVYLQLADGNTAVYAHLSAFDPALETYVRAAQHKGKTYTVDLYPDKGAFPVSQGQIIAKSGETGTPAPHLHFELRDVSGVPINPGLLGMEWPDTTRPLIQKVAVFPAALNASVNGDIVPVVFGSTHLGDGVYTAPSVAASGPIGFAVEVVDPAPGGSKLGIYQARLLLDGQERFTLQHDRVAYDDMSDGQVAYHPYLLEKGRFLLLGRWPGNDAAIYNKSVAEGWIEAPANEGEVRIEFTDFAGNQSVLRIPVKGERGEATPPFGEGAGGAEVRLGCEGLFMTVSAVFPAEDADAPVLRLSGPDGDHSVPFRRVNTTTYRAAIAPQTPGMYAVSVLHPRSEPFNQSVGVFLRDKPAAPLAFGEVTVSASAKSAFGALFVQAYPLAESAPAPIPKLGAAYRVWPENIPIDEPITLSLPMPPGASNPERIHIYRRSGGAWSRLDTNHKGDRLEVKTGSFGDFVALEDTLAPSLSEVLPAQGYKASSRRPYIRATVSDTGAGIQDIRVTCSGKWLLTEYQPYQGRLEWLRDEDLPPGEQEIVFQITDAAGNLKTESRRVVIPG